MRLNNYELHLPQYSIGNAVYEKMGKVCRPCGSKAVVIGGTRAMAAAKEKLDRAAEQSGIVILDYILYGKDCTFETVEKLKQVPAFLEADMVFAVGGGKVIDTCKCLCEQTGKTIFSFPTIASNCAACTTVSIMYSEDGTFQKPYFFLEPPRHAFIDTEIIAAAPAKYLWAGIGDTYAKCFEAVISSRVEVLPHYTAMGVNTSKMCLEPLLVNGPRGYADNQKGTCSVELEETVLAIIVTTAIASIFLTRDFTPDYNSGLAHAVFYALTAFPAIEEKHLHGEVVGFGVLIALLVDGDEGAFREIYGLNRRLGLPVRLSDIDMTYAEFEGLFETITQMSDLNHYPYQVTGDMLKLAVLRLEAMA